MKISLSFLLLFISSFQVLADNLSDSNQLFDWAEENFPQFFSPPGGETFEIDVYLARHYPDTNIYLGTSGNDVYVHGDLFGGLMHVGVISDYIQPEQESLVEFTVELLEGKSFYRVQTNASGGETCILEMIFTSSTITATEWVYHADDNWVLGCQEDYGEMVNVVNYTVNNSGEIQWATSYVWPFQLNEISAESYTVSDPDGASFWYFTKEKVNSLLGN